MATYTAKQRKALAAKGLARPDGSFPIEDEASLKNAISTYGLAKNKAGAKAWICPRFATNNLAHGITSYAKAVSQHLLSHIAALIQGPNLGNLRPAELGQVNL